MKYGISCPRRRVSHFGELDKSNHGCGARVRVEYVDGEGSVDSVGRGAKGLYSE